MPDEFLQEPRVAYFSMEIALRTEIPTYAGGLEVLGGDFFASSQSGASKVFTEAISRHAYAGAPAAAGSGS